MMHRKDSCGDISLRCRKNGKAPHKDLVMTSFLQDLRHSLRMLVKNPGLTATCVITLSLGIGLSTMMFCLINGSLYEPMPFEDARDIYYFNRNQLSEGVEQMGVSIHDFNDWRQQQTSFEDLAAYYTGTVNLNNQGERPVRYDGAFITPGAFETIRVRPIVGRLFTEEERELNAPPVILIGYDVWQTRFAGDPVVIGTTSQVNGETMTIVGVMPEGFVFPMEQDVWLPLRMNLLQIERSQGLLLQVMGRIKEGISIKQARAEFATIASNLEREYPETNEGIGVGISTITGMIMDSQSRLVLHLMLIATMAVLLIACFNVANILLARASMRTKEMAVRSSLGAGRNRLISQILMEAFGFALIGSILGLVLSQIGVSLFDQWIAPTDPPWWFDFGINLNVLLFVISIVIISTIFSGIFPALQASRTSITEVLKDDTRGASSFRMSRLSKALVVAEIAFSFALLFSAGLITKSVINLNSFDFGVDSDNVLTARVGLFDTEYPTVESRSLFWRKLHTSLNETPSIVSASLTPNLPLRGADGGSFVFEGVEYPPDADLPTTKLKLVGPRYFETFGIDLLQGRDFNDADIAGGLIVAIVNKSFADRWTPGESPLGKKARGADGGPDDPWFTIIGVVADEWTDNENDSPEMAYGCLFQADANFISLALKTQGDPMSQVPAVRDAVMSVDNDLPIYWVMSMSDSIFEITWFYGVFGSIIMISGLFALFLATIGLYAVMAFSVNRRIQEIGVRMALGAQPDAIVKMIVKQGTVHLLLGLLIGLLLSIGLAQGMQMILFGVSPADPGILALIIMIIIGTGIVASLIPAMRATKVDPVSALRQE